MSMAPLSMIEGYNLFALKLKKEVLSLEVKRDSSLDKVQPK